MPKPLPPEVTTLASFCGYTPSTWGKSAVGLGTFPKVEKGAALNGVHQGIVRELGTGGGWSAGLVFAGSCCQYQAEERNIER